MIQNELQKQKIGSMRRTLFNKYIENISRKKRAEIDSGYKTIIKLNKNQNNMTYKCITQKKGTDGDAVVLKKKKITDANKRFVLNEPYILQQILMARHPHIIKLRNIFINDTDDSLFMEMEDCGVDLEQYMMDNSLKKLPTQNIQECLGSLLKALCYSHMMNVVHCDVKPSNILVKKRTDGSKSLDVQLTDFEVSLLKASDEFMISPNINVNSQGYRPPEILTGQPFNESVDIWSTGCVLVFMCDIDLAKRLFVGSKDIQQELNAINIFAGPLPMHLFVDHNNVANTFRNIIYPSSQPLNFHDVFATIDESPRDMVRRMLAAETYERHNAQSALMHDYLYIENHK